jgi:cytochrome c oxidase cbb3-type subunit 3
MTSDAPEVAERPRPEGPERDGIREEDNPIPLWFNVTFYGSIAIAIVYVIFFNFSGWSQRGRYEEEVARAAERFAAVQQAVPAAANPFRGDGAAIAEGKQLFDTICSACHLADGRGLVGPSLIDPYWKYGHDDASLYQTVASGRPGGMPGWLSQLGQEKVWKALAYLETLPRTQEPGVGAPDFKPPTAPGGGS